MERIVVDSKKVEYNIRIVKDYIANHKKGKIPKLIGVVKGNGYGLGLIEFSKALIENDINILGVAKYTEGVELRKNNIDVPILFLSSTCIEDEIRMIIDNNIIPTIGSFESLKKYNAIAKEMDKKIDVHILIETGFGRAGIKLDEINEFSKEYMKCKYLNIVGAFSHFSDSFSKKRNTTDKQFEIFKKAINTLEKNDIKIKMKHIGNSCTVFKYPEYYLDAIRVGSAFTGRLNLNKKYGLLPVGYLETRVCEIENLNKGSNIGYGNMFKTKKDTTIGIIQTGYVDGMNLQKKNNNFRFIDILRETKNTLQEFIKPPKKEVLINKNKYEIISGIRVSDIVVDITKSDVKVGDKVNIDVNPMLMNSNIKREYL